MVEQPEDKDEIRGRLLSGLALPEEPGIEELARDWTLTGPTSERSCSVAALTIACGLRCSYLWCGVLDGSSRSMMIRLCESSIIWLRSFTCHQCFCWRRRDRPPRANTGIGSGATLGSQIWSSWDGIGSPPG